MRKFVTIYLLLILIIAGLLFKDLVIGLFRGMTPLEAMKQIVTFMLHVTVVTILAYVFFGFHKIIEGWQRFFRKIFRKRKPARRAPTTTNAALPGRRTRLTETERLIRLWTMLQQIEPRSSSRSSKRIAGDGDAPRLKF